MTTVDAALKSARARFTDSASPDLDAELLLAHALKRGRTWLRAWPEARIEGPERERFDELVARRAAGEPIAHLLGEREFRSLAFEITPQVLIPRPETETLVDAVLAHLRDHEIAGPAILDMGTGSGCIAVSLAHERPDSRVVATDVSDEALAVARRNAARHGVTNIEFLPGRWFSPLGRRHFDAIVSNPPYVRSDDPHLHRGDVRFEPLEALDGGPDGLAALREIAAAAPHYLKPGGLLAVEHGHDQADDVATLFRAEGLTDVELLHDPAGLPRVTLARKRKNHE